MEKSPKDDDKTSREIAKWTTAFMNTSGGLIVLYCNKPDSDQQRDRWLMGLESVLINNWIPESTFQSLVRFQYLEFGSQLRIYMFLGKAFHKVTFTYNAFGRQATGIRPIKDSTRIRQLLDETDNSSASVGYHSVIKKLLAKEQSLKINDPIPAQYRENNTIEFKHCYRDKSNKNGLESFGAKEFHQRLHGDGGYMEYISAFANTHGGSLVIGVEEGGKLPIVRGFNITEDEKQKITSCLRTELNKCIWHGYSKYKPSERDWDILYHGVIEEGEGPKRQIIEICVPKHPGGMFIRSPIYYMVDKSGKLDSNVQQLNKDDDQNKGQDEDCEVGINIQVTMFKKWKQEFQADFTIGEATQIHTWEIHHNRNASKAAGEHNSFSTNEKKEATNATEKNMSRSKEMKEPSATTHEMKLSRSFRESQTEHKTDITVHGLNLKDCCSGKMAKYIQALDHTKTWYPRLQTIQHRFSEETRFVELMNFIDASDWNGVASVTYGRMDIESKDHQIVSTVDNCSLTCCVLILRKSKAPILMVCMKDDSGSGRTQDDLDKLVEYALRTGRIIKQQYLAGTANMTCQSFIFRFEVEVLLVPTKGYITKIWDSTCMNSQPVTYPYADGESLHSIACSGLAEWLLKTRRSVKDRYGGILTEHLTEAQAKILFNRDERVLVVSGKSGTGKTIIALHLVHEALSQGIGDEDVLYICGSEGLGAFIKSQVPCQVMVLRKSDGVSQRDLLKRKLVIVDDIHAIKLQENWRPEWEKVGWQHDPTDFYMMLFLQAAGGTNVAIFFDPDQDYDENLPQDFDKQLRDLAVQVDGILTQDVQIVTLTERIRNSREINRFMQANQNQARIPGTISCLNEQEGDDVVFDYIGKDAERSVNVLNEKLCALEKQYSPKSIAVLFDDIDQLTIVRSEMIQKFKRTFQTVRQYPVSQMVFCTLEDFGGLEADVVLFLLPPNFATDAIKIRWKYVNMISSRAKQRLELLLPWDPKEDENDKKKLTNLLELFKTVSGL